MHRHIPNDDKGLSKDFPELDLVVGGHSHTFMKEGWFEGKTLVVQAGYRGDFIGRVEMLWDSENKRVLRKTAKLVEVDPEEGEDPEIRRLLQPLKDEYDSELGAPLFEIKFPIFGQRSGTFTLELPLGNLICHALRTETQTEVALFNSGGIRSSLPAGIIKRRNVLGAFHFRNLVAVVVLKGVDLIALLNEGIRAGDFQDQSYKFPESLLKL